MKRYIYLIIVLIIFMSINCSDWIQMPDTPGGKWTVKEKLAAMVPYEISSPPDISVIYYSGSIDGFLGTKDGKIYRSNDDGKTWVDPVIVNPDAQINCILSLSDEYLGATFIFAGTNRGIYKSIDNGRKWNMCLEENGYNGFTTFVRVFTIEKNTIERYYGISAYGYDGSNNIFYSRNGGVNWNRGKLNTEKESIEVMDYAQSTIQKSKVVVYYDNAVQQSLIQYNYQPGTINSFILNTKINSIIFENDRTDIAFAGSTDGIYKTTDAGKTWKSSGLKDTLVSSLFISESGPIFAGTKNGLYKSGDGASIWIKNYLSSEDLNVKKISSREDIIFSITDKGKCIYFRLPDDTVTYLVPPLLVEPKNNAIVSNDPILRWINWNSETNGNFDIEVSESSDFNLDVVNIKNYKNMFYQLTGLKNNTDYYWRVRAINLVGMTNWSKTFSFRFSE